MARLDWGESAYVGICIWPRSVIREIVDRDPRDRVVALVLVAAVTRTLANPFLYWRAGFPKIASITASGDRSLMLVMAALVIWPLLAVPLLYLNGIVLRWTGLLFGGSATALNVRVAYAWSRVPLILSGLVYFPMALVSRAPQSLRLNWAYIVLPGKVPPSAGRDVLFLALAIWNIVVAAKCFGEVHKISAWLGLGASVLGSIVIEIGLWASFASARYVLLPVIH